MEIEETAAWSKDNLTPPVKKVNGGSWVAMFASKMTKVMVKKDILTTEREEDDGSANQAESGVSLLDCAAGTRAASPKWARLYETTETRIAISECVAKQALQTRIASSKSSRMRTTRRKNQTRSRYPPRSPFPRMKIRPVYKIPSGPVGKPAPVDDEPKRVRFRSVSVHHFEMVRSSPSWSRRDSVELNWLPYYSSWTLVDKHQECGHGQRQGEFRVPRRMEGDERRHVLRHSRANARLENQDYQDSTIRKIERWHPPTSGNPLRGILTKGVREGLGDIPATGTASTQVAKVPEQPRQPGSRIDLGKVEECSPKQPSRLRGFIRWIRKNNAAKDRFLYVVGEIVGRIIGGLTFVLFGLLCYVVWKHYSEVANSSTSNGSMVVPAVAVGGVNTASISSLVDLPTVLSTVDVGGGNDVVSLLDKDLPLVIPALAVGGVDGSVSTHVLGEMDLSDTRDVTDWTAMDTWSDAAPVARNTVKVFHSNSNMTVPVKNEALGSCVIELSSDRFALESMAGLKVYSRRIYICSRHLLLFLLIVMMSQFTGGDGIGTAEDRINGPGPPMEPAPALVDEDEFPVAMYDGADADGQEDDFPVVMHDGVEQDGQQDEFPAVMHDGVEQDGQEDELPAAMHDDVEQDGQEDELPGAMHDGEEEWDVLPQPPPRPPPVRRSARIAARNARAFPRRSARIAGRPRVSYAGMC
jgi:hypothetical protein